VCFSNFLSPPARRAYASESGMDDLFWKPKSRYTADAVRQSEAIDLPQKVLIWKDEVRQVGFPIMIQNTWQNVME
jgi:hypothetical protein